MEHILGWLTLFLILSIIIIRTKEPDILKFLLVGFLLRAVLVILDQYFISLPGGSLDAKSYESYAFYISNNYGLSILLKMFTTQDVALVPRIISVFYSLTSRSEMMAQGISVALGTGSIYLVYRMTLIIWDKNAAIKASWLMALHPSMVLFSALVLREAYVTFFLLLTLILSLILIRKLFILNTNLMKINYLFYKENLIYFILIFFGFYFLKNLHGAIFLGYFVFLIFVVYYFLKYEFSDLKKGKLKVRLILIISLIFVPFTMWYFEMLLIPYIPSADSVLDLKDILLRRFNVGSISLINGPLGSNFPAWTIPSNNIDFIPKIFLRIIYFMYSPFPWDIKRYAHLMGLTESILMIYISICFWKNKRLIWKNPQTRFLFILLITYLITYGLGTSNFGTSIRHKTKFIFIFVCLAAPKLLNLMTRKKKN
jgi:4-amino-4-deoxy-L-arabinose transferase-like glycosyltransferase